MILDVEFWGSRLSFTSTGEVAQGMSSELNMIRFGILLKVNLYNKLMGVDITIFRLPKQQTKWLKQQSFIFSNF